MLDMLCEFFSQNSMNPKHINVSLGNCLGGFVIDFAQFFLSRIHNLKTSTNLTSGLNILVYIS